MLKVLFHPLVALLFVSASSFYMVGNSTPVMFSMQDPVAAATATASPHEGVTSPSTLAAQPQPRRKDIDAMLVIDNSGSMFGYRCRSGEPIAANDAENLRIRGAEIIIGALAADLKPRETKLGIVTFGDTAELVRPLTQLSNEDATIRSTLVSAIQNPACQGDTNIVAAMRTAYQELRSERANPENTPAIIFLTDGAPTSGGGTPEIQQLLAEMGDISFFTVILGKDPQLEGFKRFWEAESERHANVSVYSLNTNDEIPSIYKEIAAHLNDTPGQDNVPTLPPGQNVVISVPANVQQMTLTILKPAASVPILVHTPDSTDIHQLPPDRFRVLSKDSSVEVFVVQRPAPGDWTVIAPDGDTVIVLKPEFRSIYEVQLLQPDVLSLLGVDQPTTLLAQVIDNEQRTPITGDFRFNVAYRLPDRPIEEAQAIDMQPLSSDPGRYTGEIAPQTFANGQEYLFSLAVEDAAGLRSAPTEYLLPAGWLPSITSLTATPVQAYVDQPVMLEVIVDHAELVQGQAVPQLAAPLPNGITPTFSVTNTATFRSTLPPMQRAGTYTLTVNYDGQTNGTRSFHSAKNVTIQVVERPQTIILRMIALLIALLTGLYLLFRYVLLAPLIPVFQRVGISPQGYIRIHAPGQLYAEEQRELRTELRRNRRVRTLSIGPTGDIRIAPELQENDSEAPAPRIGWRTRLFGPPALGTIGRHIGGSTFILAQKGASRLFSQGVNDVQIASHQIEYSLKPIDEIDDSGL